MKKTKKKMTAISFRPAEGIREILENAARATGRSISSIVNDALKSKLPDVLSDMVKEQERASRELLEGLKSKKPNNEK